MISRSEFGGKLLSSKTPLVTLKFSATITEPFLTVTEAASMAWLSFALMTKPDIATVLVSCCAANISF